MKEFFAPDPRLGIPVPAIIGEWDLYSKETQDEILFHWEQIRGKIPDRIADLEKIINQKQAQLADESSFSRSCELNHEIAELASIINDLWLWYRTNQTVTEKLHS